MKILYNVYEERIGEDDLLLASGLTEQEARKLVNKNPRIRCMLAQAVKEK